MYVCFTDINGYPIDHSDFELNYRLSDEDVPVAGMPAGSAPYTGERTSPTYNAPHKSGFLDFAKQTSLGGTGIKNVWSTVANTTYYDGSNL